MTTILVVDDEPDIVSTLSMVLELEGYRVLDAPNGKEALVRIAETRPDLILSDIMMPFMSGLELLAAIKSDHEIRAIPVVIMSAGRPDSVAVPYPWDGFLAKPISLDDLLQTITMILERPAGASP